MKKLLESRPKAVLVLEDGTVFEGNSIGVRGVSIGEVIFNTAMTGYQEILTDPSYAKQIITFTYPHIGNTGINDLDHESDKIYAAGIIVQSLSEYAFHWCSRQTLNDFLIEQNIIGICGIDTRALTLKLRETGSLQGCIISDPSKERNTMELFQTDSSNKEKKYRLSVACRDRYATHVDYRYHIVLIDYGVKKSILQTLRTLSCKITILPANCSASEVLKHEPIAVVLSNGPGDPMQMTEAIQTIKILLKQHVPILGICLGCQLLGLALGGQTYKMPFGHHGSNHPVQDLRDKSVLISAQNHNFCISDDGLPDDIIVTHRSLFDDSIQGIQSKRHQIFGLQGHPEAGPGPGDMKKYFQEFLDWLVRIPLIKQQAVLEK